MNKMISVLVVSFILLLSISVCSATTLDNNIIIEENNIENIDTYHSTATNFTDLQKDINEYDNLELTKDIKLSNNEENLFKNGIIINKNITINGNGHTIDANNKSAFFMLNGKDITLNNIYLTNSNTIFCNKQFKQ